VEPGETPRQALVRELEEELGILVTGAAEVARYVYSYPGKTPIELFFFRVTAFGEEPRNRIFHELRWEPQANLATFDFVEGDLPFLRAWRL
jgi:8-oxo-dGTP diphosphatase